MISKKQAVNVDKFLVSIFIQSYNKYYRSKLRTVPAQSVVYIKRHMQICNKLHITLLKFYNTLNSHLCNLTKMPNIGNYTERLYLKLTGEREIKKSVVTLSEYDKLLANLEETWNTNNLFKDCPSMFNFFPAKYLKQNDKLCSLIESGDKLQGYRTDILKYIGE